MITCSNINVKHSAGIIGDCSLGNRLSRIAGIIGIATKKGYSFGFPKWIHQEYFVNPLPVYTGVLKKKKIRPNFNNYDFGFMGFDYQDNIDLDGEFNAFKYFEHCEDIVRHYFELKPQCQPYKDTILMHYRDYSAWPAWNDLQKDYYEKALSILPKKPVIVVTNNIDKAFSLLGSKYQYTSNTPIVDFYLMANADYLVMANSTFSGWAGYLSGGVVIAPNDWYAGELKNAPKEHLYYKEWIRI